MPVQKKSGNLFALDPYFIMLSVKGGIKYHFSVFGMIDLAYQLLVDVMF